jgi:chromosome segregation protein
MELSTLQQTLSELHTQIEESRLRKTNLEQSVQALTSEYETSRGGIDERARSVSDLRVNSASKRQEAEGLERELLLVETTYNDIVGQLAQMSAESERNNNTLTTSQVAVEGNQTELQRLIHQTSEAEMAVGRVRDEFEVLQATVRQNDEELSAIRSKLNEQRARMNEAQLRMEQLKMKETYLVEQMMERYMVNLREMAGQYRDANLLDSASVASGETSESFPSLQAKMDQYGKDVEELREKLKRIGEVNLSAIQEYDDVIKRYEFLNQQHTDLLEAKENLRKVIERINRICSKRFKETFEQVNERFQKVFPVLFGGGEASLVLVDGPDMDDPGIDIISRPPGKKMQNVTLLSGGEKALTAVSLIFSIFLVKPSPFCLLDEVDAPLDDANVFRFNDLVKEMAKRSQIIIVTHNKHTMKVNKKLYGVTMQEKGVSKMVSVSLMDAEKIALV